MDKDETIEILMLGVIVWLILRSARPSVFAFGAAGTSSGAGGCGCSGGVSAIGASPAESQTQTVLS